MNINLAVGAVILGHFARGGLSAGYGGRVFGLLALDDGKRRQSAVLGVFLLRGAVVFGLSV